MIDLQGIVRVIYIGEQPDFLGGHFSLYNLLDEMGEYPIDSTVSENTIFKSGFAYLVVEKGDTT